MKISQFADASGLTPDTVRYYEKIGLLPPVPRDPGGRRSYGPSEIAWAGFLQKLQNLGMPMRQRLEYGRLRAEGDATLAERRILLESYRDALLVRQRELEDGLAALDRKIAHYRDMETEIERKEP